MSPRPFVLTVANRKGGTGKTTTSVNLAAEFAARGLKTLVVDLDTQAHVTLGLRLREQVRETVHGALFQGRPDGQRLSAAVTPAAQQDLWVLPAAANHEPAEPAAGAGAAEALAAAIQDSGFDVVVIDTPPSLDSMLKTGIAAADGVLVPLVPNSLDYQGVQQLGRLFFSLSVETGRAPSLLGVAPVMHERGDAIQQSVRDALQRQFGTMRLFRAVRRDRAVAAAFSRQLSVRDYAPNSRGAFDYHLLAEELLALSPLRD